MTFVAGLLAILLADQSLKVLLRHTLGPGTVRLGPFGALRVVQSSIWIKRLGSPPSFLTLWSLWLCSAGALAILCALFPSCGWFAGLLVGGSLSHALESSIHGSVSDYVCLRFWPAFNLADVAIAAGATGVVLEMFMWIIGR